jgi:hypothetical protein
VLTFQDNEMVALLGSSDINAGDSNWGLLHVLN